MPFENYKSGDDVSTIASLVPMQVGPEIKPGVYPGWFVIPPAKDGMEVLHVGPSTYYYHDSLSEDSKRGVGIIPITQTSLKMAKSVVDDYLDGQIERIPGECEPGIFAVFGKWSKKEISERFPVELLSAKTRQKNWFVALIKRADDDWARTHQLKSITEMQRKAAAIIGVDKDWAQDEKMLTSIKCPACLSMLPAGALVCSICKAIVDKEAAVKAGLTFVGA